MRTLYSFVIGIILLFSGLFKAQAQTHTIELLAGNTLNGAINGTLLGGAVMGLTGNSDFGPIRVGLGLGTLYGVGVGAYDVMDGNGEQILVSGLFNDGSNTSILVLLDTFYGIGAGAVIASSVMLIANEPLVDGLRYGASAGAFAGFGLGLIDAFMLSERVVSAPPISQNAEGMIGIKVANKTSIGFISPSIVETISFADKNIGYNYTPGVKALTIKINL